jgi:undecaprenyl-diphosphatase
MKILFRASFAVALAWAGFAHAGGGPLGIDHAVTLDQSGIWSRHNQQLLEVATMFTVMGGAVWEGGESRLGRTYWQAVDSAVLATGAATAGKYIFQRSRPSQTSDPNKWGQGSGNYSFPSGEVAFISAAVTPFVIEYGHDHPWVYALEALPAYDAAARVKSRAHWQSDVLAAWGLGTATGWYASTREKPFMLSVLPHAVQVGYSAHW